MEIRTGTAAHERPARGAQAALLVHMLAGGILGGGTGLLVGGLALPSLPWGLLAGVAGIAAGVFTSFVIDEGDPHEVWDR
jgi:hypothetical protein